MKFGRTSEEKPSDLPVEKPDGNQDYRINPFGHYLKQVEENLAVKDVGKADMVIGYLRPTNIKNGHQQVIPFCSSVEEFKIFGHGLFYYFYSLRFFAGVFILLSAICLIPLGFNLAGSGLDEFPNIPFWMKTTVLNAPILLSKANATFVIQNVTQLNQTNGTLPIELDLIFPALFANFSSNYTEFMRTHPYKELANYAPIASNASDFCRTSTYSLVLLNCSNSLVNAVSLDNSILSSSSILSASVSNSSINDSYVSSGSISNSSIASTNFTSGSAVGSDISSSWISANSVSGSLINQTNSESSSISQSTFVNISRVYMMSASTSTGLNSTFFSGSISSSRVSGSQIDNSTLVLTTLSVVDVSFAALSNSTANASQIFRSNITFSNLSAYFVIDSAVNGSILDGSPTPSPFNYNYGYIKASNIIGSILINTNIMNSTVSNCNLTNVDVYNSSISGRNYSDSIILDNVRHPRKGSLAPGVRVSTQIVESPSNGTSPNQTFINTTDNNSTQLSPPMVNTTDNRTNPNSSNINTTQANSTTPEFVIYKNEVITYFTALDTSEGDKYFIVNIVCDSFFCITFLASIYFFKLLVYRKLPSVDDSTMSIAKYAIELQNLPAEGTTKEELVRFVQGISKEQIVSIQFAYDFQGALGLLLEKHEVDNKLKELQTYPRESPMIKRRIEKAEKTQTDLIRAISLKSKELKLDFNHIQNSFKPYQAYVIFNSSTAPKLFMEEYISISRTIDPRVRDENADRLYIRESRIKARLPHDVYNLNFEQVGTSLRKKVIKLAIFFLFIAGLIALTTYICNLIENGIEDSASGLNCDSNRLYLRPPVIDSESMDLKCYCDTNLNRMLNKDYRADCGTFILSSASTYYAPIVVVIVLTAVNYFIEILVNWIFNWTGFVCKSTQISLKIIVLFLFEYINIISVLFITSASGSAVSSTTSGQAISKKLDLIGVSFFIKTGNKIIMLNFVGAILPHLLNLAYQWGSRLAKDRLAKKAKLQKDYIELKKPSKFEFEPNYVYFLTTIATALTFSGGIPILVLFAAMALLLAYWVNKFIFLKFGRRPRFFSQELVFYVIAIMPFLLLFHIFFSVSVFGDPSLFLSGKNSEYWTNLLLQEPNSPLLNNINIRIVKCLALVIIGSILILFVLVEFLGTFAFRDYLLTTFKLKLRPEAKSLYLTEYPGLLYNSALNFDFRMLPKYCCLVTDTTQSALLSMAVVQDPEKDMPTGHIADPELKQNFESYMKNFLLYCREGYVVNTDHNMVTI
jgi:hypothetical protein